MISNHSLVDLHGGLPILSRLHRTAARRTLWRRFSPLTERETHIPDVYRGYELTPERLRLLRALSRLPEKERAALLLFEVAGFSHEEIRTIQGDRSLSAVKSRLSRTRARMRSILDEDAVGGNAGPAISPIQSLEKETIRAAGDALKILKESR